jgi:hypothetical protein
VEAVPGISCDNRDLGRTGVEAELVEADALRQPRSAGFDTSRLAGRNAQQD